MGDDILSGLNEELSTIIKNLNALRTSHAALAALSAVSERFQIEQEIKKKEEDIERVKRNIEKHAMQKAYEAMLRLDYHPQHTLYEQLQNKAATAFLIHGKPAYGQLWLLNRLLRNFNSKCILVDAGRRALPVDLPTLWRELACRCGLQPGASHDEIAGKVCDLWRTQNVVLIFLAVHRMRAEWLRDLFQDLWRPLVEKVERSGSTELKTRLIMFLLDEIGKTAGGVEFGDKVDNNWHPATPVALPRLKAFSSKMVGSWLENSINQLPLELTGKPAEVAKMLITGSKNGVPEQFFVTICEKCGGNWYDYENTWLKYR
jgi:hypothetical protein